MEQHRIEAAPTRTSGAPPRRDPGGTGTHRARAGIVIVLVIGLAAVVAPTSLAGAGTRTTFPPDPPTGVDAAAISEGFAAVSWNASATNGSPVTGYRVTSDPGGHVVDVGPSATSAQFWSLTDGIRYRFQVVATSAVGDSAPSAWSNWVRPSVCTDGLRGPGPFPDVPETSPFCVEIDWFAGVGMTGAYPDGTFRPTVVLTRQAMAAFLMRAYQAAPWLPPVVATFLDVPTSHLFFEEIEWVANENIAQGYPDGTFRPTNAVTRQAMAAFLYRANGSPALLSPALADSRAPWFSDVPPSHPFYDAIMWMVQEGIATGYPDGTFRPTAPLTRQATAAFFFRALDG